VSSRRRKRRAVERRLAKEDRKASISPWGILVIVLVASAVGLARSCQ